MLACHNYQSGNLKFPPGGTDDGTNFRSFLVDLLPFMDQGNLADDFKRGDSLDMLSSNSIESFLCASATQRDELANIGTGEATHYYGSMGAIGGDAGTDGTDGWASLDGNGIGGDGIFSPVIEGTGSAATSRFDRRRAKNFGDVADGASNTVGLLEVAQSRWEVSSGFVESKRAGWAHAGTLSMDNVSEVYSGITLEFTPNAFLEESDFPGAQNQPVGSNHPGGSQIGLVDGSARFLNDGVNLDMLKAATGISDGEDSSLE